MLFTKAALIVSSLVVLTVAQDADASNKGLSPGRGRTPNPGAPGKLMSKRDLEKRCTGSCAECFGTGYTLCPDSSIYCYLPGDATYGLDSCDSSGSSDSTPTTTASSSSSTDTSGVDDICSQTGATCQSCFGPTYLDCPDNYHCYDPNDPLYDTCPDDGSSSSGGGSSSGGTTDSSCASLYGVGNIQCGTDACYDPTAGESCCAGGFYCEAGYTCSSTIGKCSVGSGSSGSTSTFDSNLLTTSSYNFNTFASSTTNDFGFTTPTATTTGSGSGSTGINLSSDTGDANALAAGGLGRGLLVVVAFGVGMLVL